MILKIKYTLKKIINELLQVKYKFMTKKSKRPFYKSEYLDSLKKEIEDKRREQ